MIQIKPLMAAFSAALIFAAAAPLIAVSHEISDSTIQSSLATTYALNKHLGGFDIVADVHNRMVYLKGSVETPIERDLAGEIARSAKDVKGVENNILVEHDDVSLACNNPNALPDRFVFQSIDEPATAKDS